MSDKLADLREGDRVRITFEGVVSNDPDRHDVYPLAVQADGRSIANIFHVSAVANPTFKIERITRPVVVGSRVKTASGRYASVLAFSSKGLPVIEYDGEGSCTQFVNPLEVIS